MELLGERGERGEVGLLLLAGRGSGEGGRTVALRGEKIEAIAARRTIPRFCGGVKTEYASEGVRVSSGSRDLSSPSSRTFNFASV